MALYMVVFWSGAVLMSLEMIGSRLLAPTFGSSIYIWGSLITVVMTALTLGYYLGGKVADRRPRMSSMGVILALAGIFIGCLPFWTTWLSRILGRLEPRLGSLLAALSFFFIPSVMLAMISPYGVKLAGRSLRIIGSTAGRLAAVSSAGSVLGTLVTSFFLVPALGVRNIVRTQGLVLLLLAAVSFWASPRYAPDNRQAPARRALVVSIFILILMAVSFHFQPVEAGPHAPGTANILFMGDSAYHHIVVDEQWSERHLHFDASYQSAMYINDPFSMVFSYTSAVHLGVVARPEPRRILFIGLGGGLMPRRFLHDYDSIEEMDVAEIDPEVAEIAERFFDFPADDPRVSVAVQDGRLFVEDRAEKVASGKALPYDMIVIDAYSADTIPYHLTTREFLLSLRKTLAPDGVVVSNIIGASAGPYSRLLRSMTRTFTTVFPQTYLFPMGGSSSWNSSYPCNVVLIATRDDRRVSADEWTRGAEDLYSRGVVKENVAYYAGSLVEGTNWEPGGLEDAPLLTDDYAPVDTMQPPLF